MFRSFKYPRTITTLRMMIKFYSLICNNIVMEIHVDNKNALTVPFAQIFLLSCRWTDAAAQTVGATRGHRVSRSKNCTRTAPNPILSQEISVKIARLRAQKTVSSRLIRHLKNTVVTNTAAFLDIESIAKG